MAKANALCVHSQAVRQAATAKFGANGPTRAQLIAYVRKVFVPSIQRNIDQIRALGFPAADRASLTQTFSLAQIDLNKAKANPTLVASGPGLFHNFAVLIHRYGLTECAKNG